MTNYLVIASFGETIEYSIPVDAFGADGFDEHAEKRWLEQNIERLTNEYSRAEGFRLYRMVAD